MRSLSVFGLTVGLLASCAAPPEPLPEAARPFFQTQAEGIAYIDRVRPCKALQTDSVPGQRIGNDTRPTRVRACIPDFPFRLQDRGFNAGCLARFDLDDGGIPTNVMTACNTISVSGFMETDIADAMFERLMHRVISEMRYLPAAEEGPDVQRANLRQPAKFVYENYENAVTYPEIPAK